MECAVSSSINRGDPSCKPGNKHFSPPLKPPQSQSLIDKSPQDNMLVSKKNYLTLSQRLYSLGSSLTMPSNTDSEDKIDVVDVGNMNSLGTHRLRHEITHEIVLVPVPTDDPNDPLNWSKPYKLYVSILICLAMLMCNFLSAGPSVAIVAIAEDFGGPHADLKTWIPKVSYFFTGSALLQGVGNLFWVPFVNKYGRRPCYIVAFILYLAFATWAGVATGYASELVARCMMSFAAGASEVLCPLTIADVYFLHERGAVMALYTASQAFGSSLGIILSGLITIHHTWRYIYYVGIALVGLLTIQVILFFPETAFRRPATSSNYIAPRTDVSDPKADALTVETPLESPVSQAPAMLKQKTTWAQNLRVYHGTFTDESLFTMFFRPLGLIVLPPVLWATLTFAVTVGFLVAISANFAPAFQETYGFQPWQSGLCFIAAIIGSAIGILCGGQFSDWVADFFTKRNNGIREPEMRIPAIALSLISTPLALILYGVGIAHNLHWIVPTIGLALLNFSIVQATNVSLVYTVDAYRPIVAEVTTTQLVFKSLFGFLLSFYTNPWIDKSGYQNAFGAMAGIAAFCILSGFPLFWIGKRVRHSTLKWKLMSYVRWSEDREVGE